MRQYDNLERIAETVRKYYNIDKKDFIGQRRYRYLAEPRQMYCYIAKQRVREASLKSIGKFIGHKDHSTVIHAIRKVNNLFDFDKKMQQDYKDINQTLDNAERDPVEVVLEFIRKTLPMDTDLALKIESKILEIKTMTPQYELYLITLRALSLMDELNLPEKGVKKSMRGLNRFAEEVQEKMEDVSSEAHERSVHNFNVVLNSIDNEVLGFPIGELKVEK